MATMKAILDLLQQHFTEPDHASDPDITTVADLAKLLSKDLHTCLCNAIKKITEIGYSKEDVENMVLRCGPFSGGKDIVSSIVDRTLSCLRNEGCHDAASYTFEDLNIMANYMVMEMVYMLIEVKPSLSIHEAMWTLLICDLNVVGASVADIDPRKFSTGGHKAIETPSQDKEAIASNGTKQPLMFEERIEYKCQCCKKRCSGHKRDILRQKVFRFEKPCKGRKPKSVVKVKLTTRGDLSLDEKELQSCFLSVNKKGSTSTLKESGEKPNVAPKAKTLPPEPTKTFDYYLAGIAYDEKRGVHVPQDETDKIVLVAVRKLQSLQKELQTWDEWANVKVMQATKRLSLDRTELNKLKAGKEAADNLKKDKQESDTKKLEEMRVTINTTKCEFQTANKTIARLESEKSVLKQKKEAAEKQSLLKANILEEAICKEQKTLKKCVLFESENNLLEEDLKSVKLLVSPKQQNLEKAKALLKEAETRLAKEKRKTVKFLDQASFVRKERERVEALAKGEAEMAKNEFKKNETEIKRIQYGIAALKLEAVQKGMNLQPCEWTSQSEVCIKKLTHLECVMCLSEENTVVFVPCGHQVLCAECNVIHEETGTKECPSCRTPIQKRIIARFAES